MKKLFQKTGFFCFALLAAFPVSGAGELPGQLEDGANKIYAIFKTPFITIILAIVICAAAVRYALNKDNDKVKKECLAAIVAGILIMASKEIVAMFITL